MKRMSDMAANMDPKTMESMMKNMGGGEGGMPDMGNMNFDKINEAMKDVDTEALAKKAKDMGLGDIGSMPDLDALKGKMPNMDAMDEMMKNLDSGFIFSLMIDNCL